MTLVQRLDRPSVASRAAPYVKGGLIALTLGFFGTQLLSIRGELNSLKTKPVSVAIGQNAIVEMGEPLTPTENKVEFLREVLPLLNTLSHRIPKEMDPECQANPKCTEGSAPGGSINGVRVPVLVGIAANALTPTMRAPYLTALQKNARFLIGRELNWQKGESLIFQVFSVDPDEKSGAFLVEGGYFHYSAEGQPVAAYEHTQLIQLREVLPPKTKSNLIQAQQAIAISLSRGLLIEDSEVIK